MLNSPFEVQESKQDKLNKLLSQIESSDVIFVSDFFVNDYAGGAELTTEAFYSADCNNLNICQLQSSDICAQLIEKGIFKHWVFFNYSNLNYSLIPTMVANINYTIVEYDYKYCKYRSPEKHLIAEKQICNCRETANGKIVSAFMYGADQIMWMSEAQRVHYFGVFSFLKQKRNFVIGSAFSNSTLDYLKKLREENQNVKNDKWIILDSPSWIKGVNEAVKKLEDLEYDYEKVWGVEHTEILSILSKAEGFIFLPLGMDTCPRMVIEAKLAGCELILNKNVQHSEEEWFDKDDLDEIDAYLRDIPSNFWNRINEMINKNETFSGYTTTLNCIDQKYPFRQSIESMLGFCDQVVVVDGGSTDGTWEALEKISQNNDKILIKKNERDWNHARFAVFDGLQKAYARSLCTGNWCWQMDSDEIVHEKDYDKIKLLVKQIPKSIHLLALPVIEYWGGNEKVRMDINPWKWRLSRNYKHITHGIPKQLRKADKEGNLYALPGTDGCDYIDTHSYELIPCMHFYNQDIHNLRTNGLEGSEKSIEAYENWFNNLVENLPGVHHYSWFDLERKIKTYRGYWSKHWQSLYNIEQDDTPENNMFFNKSWADVTDEEIKVLASKLKDKMGGWIFHTKVDFDKPTPHVYVERDEPAVMK